LTRCSDLSGMEIEVMEMMETAVEMIEMVVVETI
jgi:hypothetical protein